jgi:geranylgeranyl pyrophosphate synthase
VTLPLILGRRSDPELAALDLRAEVNDAATAEAVCERVAATGALGEARGLALTHVAAAKTELTELDLSAERRRALDLVADGVVERYA